MRQTLGWLLHWLNVALWSGRDGATRRSFTSMRGVRQTIIVHNLDQTNSGTGHPVLSILALFLSVPWNLTAAMSM